jgi:multicomponent Na+:H+ antiporter subunit G
MSALGAVSALLVGLGAGFLVLGAVGLVRLPDTFSRLQAVFKTTFLGLSCLLLGLLPRAGSLFAGLKLVFVWGLFLVSLVHLGQWVGRRALRAEAGPLAPGQRAARARKPPGRGPGTR